MARRVVVRLLASAAVLLGAGLGADQALASTPTSHRSEFRFSGRVDCGSFSDRYIDRYWIRGRTFFDRRGRAVRTIDHVRHTSTDRNSRTGRVLHQHDRYTIVANLRTRILRLAGGFFRINRAGRGMVVHDVGRIVMDAHENVRFTAGRHDVMGKDADVFCAALT